MPSAFADSLISPSSSVSISVSILSPELLRFFQALFENGFQSFEYR
jgi:hypothetical protein